ncbi:MAG: alcohol dehydrogenase catalytic domain-containing protein [Planctomycetota bacterium]|jgi:L-iditol 2-dehydrogenase
MKAAVYEGKEQIVVRDVSDPVLTDGEVLIKVEACCVCGSDRRTYRHGHALIPPPRVLGHEFCGTVVETRAPDHIDIKVGDRVVMYIVMPCGTCRPCKDGKVNICLTRKTMAYHFDGAYAEYTVIPARAVAAGNLLKVQSDIPSEQMALSEPLGCSINAHGRLKIGLKDTVAVFGAGPIGVMHALLARQQGAQKVYLLAPPSERLKNAEAFGFDAYVPVTPEGSHKEEVMRLTDGYGADAIICACNSAEAQVDAVEIAARSGRVEFFGGLPKSDPTARLNTNLLHYKEITVTGSFSEKMSDFQAAVALLESGRFPADRIVTHKLPLDRMTEAFDLMDSGECLKPCIIP